MRWAVDAAAMREIDANAIETLGIPGMLLMENAGRAVADEAEHMLPDQKDSITILCGPGINGGDGFVAAKADSGLGIYESRWRARTMQLGRASRHRLLVNVFEYDEGSGDWTVRYCVERQKVKELGRAWNPTEDDWSGDGQDGTREEVFGARLAGRLGLGDALGQERPED